MSRMDETTVRAMLADHFAYAATDPDRAHAMYQEDAVLEFAQSGERFEGVANMRPWRSSYPATTAFTIQEVRGRDDLWVVAATITYDGGPPSFALDILEFRDGRIARETIYVAEGWDAPEWRAHWRAAP